MNAGKHRQHGSSRMVMRRVIGKGINAGIDAVGKRWRGKQGVRRPSPATPQGPAQRGKDRSA